MNFESKILSRMNFETKILSKSSLTQFLLLFQVWDSFTSLDLSWRGQSAVIWMRFLMLRSPVPGGTSPSLAVTQTILQQEEILLSSVVMVLPLSRYFINYCFWEEYVWFVAAGEIDCDWLNCEVQLVQFHEIFNHFLKFVVMVVNNDLTRISD